MLWSIRFLFVLSYLVLNWLSLFILKLTICILILDLGKIGLTPGLKENIALIQESARMSIFKPDLVHMYL